MRVWQQLSIAVLLGASSLGCDVLVGDKCVSATECSQTEPRLCLTERFDKFPGGYCTSFNCTPGSCPGEAVCIGYSSSPGGDACFSPYEPGRAQRSFCMRSCESDGDCRSGYRCIDPTTPESPWGASLLETDGSDPRICAVAYTGTGEPGDNEVCAVQPPPEAPDAGASLDAGAP